MAALIDEYAPQCGCICWKTGSNDMLDGAKEVIQESENHLNKKIWNNRNLVTNLKRNT
ncbi:MAG: hypothetical protein FWG89_00520 [Treponema sp.]|nr:hypothetical protein [Treponema sp.]